MQEFKMDKVFSPQDVETRIYEKWESSGAFKPVIDPEKQPFTIVMPPPNITGQLHVGHALDEMPQDVLIRYHRMKGDPTLWVPGTDHASIATEIKVVEALKAEASPRRTSAAKSSSSAPGRGRRNTAAASSASCASWASPATGRASASPCEGLRETFVRL